MEMIPQCDSKCQSTQILDEAAVDISYRHSVRKSYDPQCTNDSCRNTEPSMIRPEDEELIKDRSMDYAEMIKELHLYINMVKKLTKPGCSSEILNVALSSMTSLVETLSAVSSVQYMQSSL
ncbi:hypothetical protein ABFX02_14G159600 [Erythranthe guttata]